MPSPIEDYALVSDTETCALVGRDGSVDWLCAPRFDSPACFAALLGTAAHGHWRIAPVGDVTSTRRTYRGDSLVLETEFTTPTGRAAVIDFMPIRDGDPSLVRIVEGRDGAVELGMTLVIRFDYGSIVPWVQALDEGGADAGSGLVAVGGADALTVRADVALRGQDLSTVAVARVAAGERVSFAATWHPSHRPASPAFDAGQSLADTEQWWAEWSASNRYDGLYAEAVHRSLVTLKGLTFAPTGGIVAAPTTSLPEFIGGVRNWDYRYCWLRDATFALNALLDAGFTTEADAWIGWLRRAVAGDPGDLQIMYGVAGERRLTELELGWLPGYEHSSPVRIGNAASGQFQLDVFGEVLDLLHTATTVDGFPHDHLNPDTRNLVRAIVEHVERVWSAPDDGIWEIRGPRRHFVHSKVMAWVAVDRWIRILERLDLGAAERIDHWRALRDEIHADVCTNGFDEHLGSFTQYYGSSTLDASLLMIGLVGFLPPHDHRLIGTIDAVQRHLLVDGFVLRYDTAAGAGTVGADEADRARAKGAVVDTVDGLPPGEGAFLLTTFWLVDSLVLIGRVDEAQRLFERLLALRNDVGLLAEEYDPTTGRMVGNFPQAFSHIGLVNSAANLSMAARHAVGPLSRRAGHTPSASP